MSNFSKIFQQALPRPSALSALARWVKSLSGRGAEGATSALSLAMLVFLVQEARANAPVSSEGASSALPEVSSLDTVRQLFDAEGKPADTVAGIAYPEIVQAVSQIYAAYEAELALGLDAVRADAVDAAAMDSGAEMAVLDSYVQDAIQYAALPPEMVGMDSGADAPAAPKEEEDDRGFLPFFFFGAGVAIAAPQSTGPAPISTNNPPAVAAALSQSVREGADRVTLNLLQGAIDTDKGDALSISGVMYKVGTAAASDTIPAGLILSDKGVLTVDPTNAAFKALGEGARLTITVSYSISDGRGGTIAQTASITITGTNDAPTVGASLSQTATEGADYVTLNLLQGASDVDNGDVLSLAGVRYKVGAADASDTIPPGLSLSDTGVLTVDPTNAAFSALAAGEKLTITVSYSISDGHGGAVTQTASITITGTNQHYSSSGYAADGYISGATVFQDLNGNGKRDEGEPKGTTDASGKFSIDLVQNSTATLIVTGGTDISTGLEFTGVLKAPPGSSVVTPLTTMVQALIESSGLSLEEAKAVVSKAYRLDPNIDLLNFDAFSADNKDNPATYAFQKANIFIASVLTTGASLLSSAGGLSAEEAHLKMASAISSLLDGRYAPAADGYGYGEYQDAESIKALLVLAASQAGLAGEASAKFDAVSTDISIAIANSTRDLVGSENLEELVAAQKTAQDTLVAAINKAVSEGSAGDLTTALKHPIEIASALAISNGSTELDLLKGAKDPDTSHTLSVTGVTYKVGLADASSTIPAGMSLSGNGVLTVDPTNAAFKALGEGQTLMITVSYTITDGNGSTVAQTATITITGTNDAAVISGDTDKSLTETNAALTTSGTLSATDVDSATTFVAQTDVAGSGGYGKFSINAAGAWTYTANTAHNEFAKDQDYTDTLTVETADGTSQVITVKITGTNDAAVISGDTDKSLTETNAALTTSGTLSATDVDSATTFVAQTDVAGSGGYGKFSINAAGAWTYTANTAHNEFAKDQDYTDTLTVETADGTSQVITVKIAGTNDAAVITGDTDKSLTETDAALSTSGTLSATYVDSAASFVAQTGVAGSGGYGKFSIDASGAWTYTANTAHNEFVGGTDYTDTLTVKTSDGTSQVITVKIAGTNDAAVISGDTSKNLIETDVALTTSGTLIATDVDSAETFVAQTGVAGSGGYGKFSIGTDGAWSYTADTAHNEFAEGQDYTDTLTVKTADGTSQDITVKITGTNDAPTIGTLPLAVSADASGPSQTLELLQGASDADIGDTLSVTDLTYTIGTGSASDDLPDGFKLGNSGPNNSVLTVDATDKAYHYLNKGETLDVVLNYNVSDGHDGTVAQKATVTIQGADTTQSFVSVFDAQTAYSNGDRYGTGDTVIVSADYLQFADLGVKGVTDLKNLGVDVVSMVSLGQSGGGSLGWDFLSKTDGGSSMAKVMVDTRNSADATPMHFYEGSTVSMDVALAASSQGDHQSAQDQANGSHFTGSLSDSAHLATDGLSLADLGKTYTAAGLGVDVIDVVGADGTRGDYTVHISGTDAVAVNEANMRFAAPDYVRLDLDQSSKLNSESFSSSVQYFGGLNLGQLAGLGVDRVDVANTNKGGEGNFTLHIDSNPASGGVSGHLVTMEVHAGADYAQTTDGHATGSYINGTLSDDNSNSEHLALGGMSLTTLHALGVDVIDIVGHDGMQGSYTAHISGADAAAMAAANVGHDATSSTYMHFAASDTIKLDLSQSSGATANDFTAGQGAFGGLNLMQLAAMGVDEVHVSGLNAADQGNFTLHIDAAPTPGQTPYIVSVDVALETSDHGNGSHLATSLDDGQGGHIGGLALSQLHDLGVDVIDIVGHDGAEGDFTAHVSVTEAGNVYVSELKFDEHDHIVMNLPGGLGDLPGGGTGGALDGSLAQAVGVDAIQFAGGAEIALFGDQGLLHLLTELTTSNSGAFNTVNDSTVFEVNETADFTVSDSMVKALLDAGIFTADAASTIKVDASADTDGHVMTTLAQLVHIGADQVIVADSTMPAFIDLGNVSDAAELTSLFDSLASSQANLVTNAANVAVSETNLLLTTEQGNDANLVNIIAQKMGDSHISNVYVAGAQDSNDLILGMGTEEQHYHKLGLAG